MLGDKSAAAVLAVSDIEAAKKFYEDTLGLSMVNESQEGVTYKSGDTMLLVYPSQYAGTNKATALGWIAGDDFDKIMDGLKSKGVSFEHYPDLPGVTLEGDVHKMGESKAIWFKDPSGNILNVVDRM
ncbi:VOC family protein [Candidatus Saccharibacteria bacterium]|nr:VOC family protein [Candidatus Saccharibacteria bacterium]